MSAAWASHPHSCIPSSRAHLHLRTSCSKRFCTIRPLSCMSAPTFVGWSRSRPDAPSKGHTTIAHAHPHEWPRLCVQLLAAMDFQRLPSVIHFAPKSAKRFPTVSTGLSSTSATRSRRIALRVVASAHHEACFPFSACLVAGLLPPVRVFGLLNTWANMSARCAGRCPKIALAATVLRFASDRPFARTGV